MTGALDQDTPPEGGIGLTDFFEEKKVFLMVEGPLVWQLPPTQERTLRESYAVLLAEHVLNE